MLALYILILMFANSLNLHTKKNIHPIFINRITILTLLVSILLTFNTLYFQSIGKGIGLYSGLFQVTTQSHIVEILLIIIGISILLSWPLFQVSPLLYDSRGRYATLGAKINNINFSKLASTRNINNLSVSNSDHYSLIAIFSILGGSLLMSSLDLLSMYLSIELQSFALYILATLNKDKLSATSAGLKYFLLGGLSSCFILLGAGIIYSYTGLTQFESINTLLSVPSIESSLDTFNWAPIDINKAFTIGLVITLVGFLFKVSAAPFYQWAPDVYDGTPTIVTVWLTIVAKLTIFIFLQSILEFSLPDISSSLAAKLVGFNYNDLSSSLKGAIGPASQEITYIVKNLLLISSLLSLIVGTVAGLSQIKIKRLLALSSVSHVGFLLLALGIYSQKSVDSFIFYLVQYSLTSLNIFLILLGFGYLINKYINIVQYNTKEGAQNTSSESTPSLKEEVDINYLIDLKGQLIKNPVLSVSLAICLFSMAGIPPLIGFFSKQFVLFSSIENGTNFLSIVAILVSVISASYYLKLIKITFFSADADRADISINNSLIMTSLGGGFNKTLTSAKPVLALSLVLPDNKEGAPLRLRALGVNNKESVAVSGLNSSYFLGAEKIGINISNIHSYIISILTFLILFFFLDPSIILNGTQLISLTIFNI